MPYYDQVCVGHHGGRLTTGPLANLGRPNARIAVISSGVDGTEQEWQLKWACGVPTVTS